MISFEIKSILTWATTSLATQIEKEQTTVSNKSPSPRTPRGDPKVAKFYAYSPQFTAARLEAEILLSYILNQDRSYLFAYSEQKLTPAEQTAYTNIIKKRLRGVPIAYLTGKKEFWSLNLEVNQHTLIPRPETELLVELTLNHLAAEIPQTILDLGTGCGAIALALASERPHWQILACDKSNKALEIAQNNAARLNLKNISFFHSNWFSSIPKLKFNAIVANPPYIAQNDPHLKLGDLKFEPLTALVSEQDGLADLTTIAKK